MARKECGPVVLGHNTVRVRAGLEMKGKEKTECQLGAHDS